MNGSSEILTLIGIEAGFNESGRKTALLNDVNLSANRGEVVSVIGANGSGKSTLLRTIASLIRPLKGAVELGSRRVTDYTGGELAGLVAFVAAGSSVPLSMRVDELVSLGRFPHTNWIGSLKSNDMMIIEESLSSVGMLKLRERPLYKLSDGERQRAVIARALAQDPVLILLDEPTAFLDLPNRYDLIYLLRKLAEERGKCVVLTTHDMEIASRESDKLWLINNNRVIEGAPEDLIINGILTSLFGERNIVHLEGERRLVKLTARALERLGINSSAGDFPDSISAVNSGEGPLWNYRRADGSHAFRSIYELTTFLKEHHVNRGK
jgi:iron complex transport system ATP-binding protein